MTAAEVVPVKLDAARRFVAEHHRHSEPPVGHSWSIGLALDGELIGVVMAGRPIARTIDDGRTLELLRLVTVGDRNACSRLYGAACRAAFAMGYLRVITYTLAEESGASLRASGFVVDRENGGGEWLHGDEPRRADQTRLWGPAKRITGPKQRWTRSAQ